MVKLRLTRMGKTHSPFYRIVAIDSRKARGAEYLANIGTYNPQAEEVKIDAELAKKWLANGAQPTETVRALLKKQGIIE